jgi:hypothetical protein
MVASRSPVIPMSEWWQKEFVPETMRYMFEKANADCPEIIAIIKCVAPLHL